MLGITFEELFDLRATVVYALASKPHLFQHVDKVFNKDKEWFKNKFKESELSKEKLFNFLPVANQEYAEKIIGIMESEEKDYTTPPTILSLMNRSYKVAYKYYNTGTDVIDLELFQDVLLKKGIFPSLLNESIYQISCLAYICEAKGEKELIYDLNNHPQLLYYGAKLKTREFDVEKTMATIVKEVNPELKSKLDWIPDFVWPFKVNKLNALVYIEMYTELPQSLLLLFSKSFSAKNNKSLDYSLENVKLMYEFLYATYSLDSSVFLEQIEISKKEVVEWAIAYCSVGILDIEKIEPGEILKFVISCIHQKATLVGYNNLTSIYKNKAEELLLKENISSDKSVEVQELKTSDSFSSPDLNDYEDKIRDLEKKNKILSQELNKAEEHQQELYALRSFVYSLEAEEENSDPSLEYMIEFIKSKRIVVVGGHPIWISKMKQSFPEIRILEASSKINISFDSVSKAEILMIFTYQLKHATTRRAINEAEKRNVPIRILGNQVNEDKIVLNFYDAIKDL